MSPSLPLTADPQKFRPVPVDDQGTATGLYEPIAIIGMGVRLPGHIHTPADYWDLLFNGRSGRCRVPKSRYNVEAWYGPGRPNHVPTEFGYFLEELNLAHVDPSFWSFTKQEAERMDPRQRLFLEVAYEALQSSGTTKFRGTDVGVYVGTMGDDWSQLESRDEQSLEQVRPDVYGDYILANRASYEFDLTGPSVVVRTACSASLVALHMACRDLHGGDCTSAIVGGVNLILTPKDTTVMHQQGVLSPMGSCKSFDAEADGFARGEGVSVVYIKKLSDAVRDGDPIRAVIRSTCLSGNGRTPGLTTPSSQSHERLMRRGHRIAGITDLSKTAMVECHGTGTSVGDPIEVGAVANIWGDHGIYIGSVKPNIGHGEGASGLSSIIKMVLALENSTIPPNINFKTPNTAIPWERAKLKVPTTPLPWPSDRLERASVNSFGIGGSNAHVLLESAACFGVQSSRRVHDRNLRTSNHRLLTFSARHIDSVSRLALDVERYLDRKTQLLGDVAWSLNTRRETHAHRAFCVTDANGPFQMSSITKRNNNPPSLIWLFTGQGAQWAQMGKELLQQNVLVQQTINRLDSVLASLSDPPQWKLKDLLLAPKEQSRLAEAEFSQPCLVAIQVALVDLLRSWGVTPDAVVGHSSGETAAAYASGAITAEDAIRIAYHRGQITLLIKAAHKGSMAAVGLGRSQVQKFLRPGVMIGCENSPASVTLSGEADVLEDVMKDIMAEHPGVLARSLHVECGYHSQHMKTAEMDFTRRLEGWLQPVKPKIPFYSSVTGILNNDMSHSYWVRNVVSPVLFSTAVESVLDDFKSAAFVEIGPHSALAGPIRQILHSKGRVAQYVPTLVRNEDAVSCVLKTAGELWSVGASIELAAVTPAGNFLTDIPTYPWHYDKEYWVESRLSRSWRLRKFDHHELLGTRVEEISDACPAWRCNLRVEDVPWIRDHMILGENIFPAAGFVSMIGEALKQLKGSVNYTLGHVTFDSALVLNDRPVELVTVLNPPPPTPYLDSEWYEFSISSLSEGGDTWVRHAMGECKAGSDSGHQATEVVKLPRKVSLDSFYSTWKRFGLEYGARFRNLADASSHVTEPTAIASLQTELSDYEMASYAIHPTALDSSMHFAMVASCRGLSKNFKQMAIPTYIEELYVSRPSGKIHLEATATENSLMKLSSYITGVSDGETVIDIRGLEVEPVAGSSDIQAEDPHAGAIVEWKPDIDFLDLSLIFRHQDLGSCTRSLEKLVLACIVESRAQLQFLPATQPHFVDFKSWLDATYRKAVAGEHQDLASAFDIAHTSPQLRQALIADMLEACKGTPTESLALAVHRVYTNAAACFTGRPDAIKAIDSAISMAQNAETPSDIDLTSFLQLLGHKRPNMNVLHIGGSDDTAATINKILSALSSDSFGDRLYGNYVYACTSSEPSTPVQDCFRNFPAAKYSNLNTDADFISQGLRNESFDVILVFDAVSSSRTNLKKMRKLLKSTGRIILGQTNSASRTFQYVTGLLPQSISLSENLELQNYLRDQLQHAGFDGSSAATLLGDYSRMTIARPFSDHWKTDRISIICEDPAHHLVKDATKALRGLGVDLDFVVLGEELPWGQPVVSLLDLEGSFIHGMSQQGWEDLKKTILSAQDEKVLWVTGACQIECKNPNDSLVLGLARTLRRELSMDFVTLELESFDANGWKVMHTILNSFGQRINGGDLDPESEYVFSQGLLHISRFHSVEVSKLLQESSEASSEEIRGHKGLSEVSETDMLDNCHLPASSLTPSMTCRSDRTYVFVGGLGGLGQATARFLVERGARELIFFSRSAEQSAKGHPEYFEELRAFGCVVQAISGSVNDMDDVAKMVHSANRPIAGLLQAAMVLQDINITDMTFEQWQTAVDPKVQGTWNLHNALQQHQSEPLDFFFLFSSLSGLGGQIGQANYAAGNAFLDAFVQYRHSNGLACSVLDIGIMEDIGVLAREQNRLEALRATKQHCLHEQDLLDALELMIRRSQPVSEEEIHAIQNVNGFSSRGQVAVGMRSSATSSSRNGWQKDPRSGFLSNTGLTGGTEKMGEEGITLNVFLRRSHLDPSHLESDNARAFLAKEIGGALQGFGMREDEEVDLSRPLQTDSLVTVELRNWIRQKMGVSFTVVELRSAESIFALGQMAAARLLTMGDRNTH
ncbi:Highly reducing polyketide synthase gloL [Colletotrichum fructicola]|nr:Highly reducing polyketide synthase gloL [Colletotrichum fructicola]